VVAHMLAVNSYIYIWIST